ncbi:MAG: MGMT family protein [Propionibacteriaceae bacterium]|jgi:alkylated DNA nucleotide flippase Atl1|nr:MGMT family protein [Propionibacteriaceae bacterium]
MTLDRPDLEGYGLLSDRAWAVLSLVETIPAGSVTTYGDIAAALGRGGPGSARQVGQVMARYGGGVPWWRVVNASGRVAPGHSATALARLADEGCPLANGRVVLARARWRPLRPVDDVGSTRADA